MEKMELGMLVKIKEELRCQTGCSVGVIVEIISDEIAKIDVKGTIFKFWLGYDFEITENKKDYTWNQSDFEFYVFSLAKGYKKCSNIKEAMALFNEITDERYVAIGVEDDKTAIDIFCKKEGKTWASYDLRTEPKFYYNSLIRINSLKIIEKNCKAKPKKEVEVLASYGTELAVVKITMGSKVEYATVRGINFENKSWDYSLGYFEKESDAKKVFAEKLVA